MMFQRRIRIVQPGSHQGNEESFVGGAPSIPPELSWPRCRLCSAEQSFFFQIALPKGHVWFGKSLAMFACTSCADEKYPIPEMLSGALDGAIVSTDFLSAYQRNFYAAVFETNRGVLRDEHRRIAFCPIVFDDLVNLRAAHGRIGGRPQWLLDHEAPARLDSGEPFHFLFQLNEGLRFMIEATAPEQMAIGLNGRPEPLGARYYQLFIGNRIFFFGAGADQVYIVTQI